MDLNSIRPFKGYCLVNPKDLTWRPSNRMNVSNADFLERTGSELLGARLWRLKPGQANTLHRHPRTEEFYYVTSGVGKIRIDGVTVTVEQGGGVLVGPTSLRQLFNDTARDVEWFVVGAPEAELLDSEKGDMTVYYPVDPTQLPIELTQNAAKFDFNFESHARDWIDAWNGHDLDRIMSFYAEDVRFESPFIKKLGVAQTGSVRGAKALRDYFTVGLERYPELRFEFRGLDVGVSSCTVRYVSVQNLAATELHVVNLSGKIEEVKAHYSSVT